MTVASNPPYNQYFASNGQTVFNYTFEIVEQTDLLVYQTPTGDDPDDATQLLTLNVDYTVTGAGTENGGTIVLNVGAALNDIISIKQNVPVERDTSFTPGGVLRAQDLNVEFDNQTLIQQTSRYNELSRMLSYQNSAIVTPLVDTLIPVLGANQIWVKNANNDAIITMDVPDSGGLAPNDATYILQTPNLNLPNAQALSLLGSGIVVNTATTGVLLTRTLGGTVNQIGVLNPTGIAGNPQFYIVDNPVIPGTAGMGVPQGTTAQRVIPMVGIGLRYNTDLENLEYWDGLAWYQIQDSGDITQLIARLAAHTVGDGASMIGLLNQGSVLNKTVQDLANATLIAQTDNGTLANGQFLGALASGFVSVTTTTGVLASRIFAGTANQIDITNGDGSGAPVWSLPNTMIAPGTFQVGNILFSGNTISTTNTNGNLDLVPNGTGLVQINSTVGVDEIINDNTLNTATNQNLATALALKNYIDSTASGITFLSSAVAATTATLNATYNNGSSGVGATLTSNVNGVFSVDGLSPIVGSRILVKDMSNTAYNGVYSVTDAGSVGTPYILTRTPDFDSISEIVPGVVIPINLGGSVNGGTSWLQTEIVSVIGTDPISWIQFTAIFPLSLANGGTGANLTASNGGIVYSNASTLAILAGTPTANLPLLSGVSSAPSWGAYPLSLGGALTTAGAHTLSGAFASTFTFTNTTSVTFPTSGTLATTGQLPTPAAMTKVDDTNVTLTLGGTPATSLLQAVSLTLGWTGQLSVPRGGTGLASTTAYAVLCGGTTSTGALQSIASVGTSGQVLTSNGAGALPTFQNAAGGGNPIGTIIDFAGTSAPTDYLQCDGSAISRTTYASLFAVIGTTWGAGNGTTTFNIPDLRRRTKVGSGGTGTGVLGNAVGNTGGAETITLSTAQLASHTHSYTYPNVTMAGSAPNAINAGSISAAGVTGSAGSGSAHVNIQPSAIVLACIKYQ